MQPVFEQMTVEQAAEVAGWRYPPPYDFYNADADPGDLELLLAAGPEYFAALDPAVGLIGFAELVEKSPGVVEVGLGLRPDLTGVGWGLGFLLAVLEFAGRRFAPREFCLAVAAFNVRAIRVYERAGFREIERFLHETNGGTHAFVRMQRPA